MKRLAALALLLAACSETPQTAPRPQPTRDDVEPFVLETSAEGVRQWQNGDQMGFVYRKQPFQAVLTLGNNTGATQEKTEIEFKVQDMDGEGDLIVDGDQWTCEGEREITCTSTIVVESGGIWPALPMTMQHTKGGQTEVVVTWGEMRKSVVFRYDSST